MTHVTQVDGFGSGEGWSIRGTVDKAARTRVEGSDFKAYAKDDIGDEPRAWMHPRDESQRK